MADIKISALPVASSVSDADIVVINQSGVTKTVTRGLVNTPTGILPVANGGTGVSISSGASSVVLRDSSQNITANSLIQGYLPVVASATQLNLTVVSVPSYVVTGSGGQTVKLPDATTLQNGVLYRFNNNQSSGAIDVNNNSNTLVASIPSGGLTEVSLLDNSTAAGSWERHEQAPSNVTWSTNTFDYAGSITNATWNGVTVAVNRGGTGATSQAAALTALAAMATSERANYIPTTQLASLATTTQLAAITPVSIGAMATSERATYATTTQVAAITASSLGALSTAQAVTIGQGGTGQTTQQAALNAIAGAVTINQVLKGNGTNVSLAALTSADIPTLPISKLTGVAASGANSDITSVGLTTGTVSTNPSGVTDIVNKAYADSIGSGINFHDACDYGTIAVLSPTATYNQPAGTGVGATLTGQTNTALQIDGVTVSVGKRVLVKNQTSAFQNGVYNVTQQGDGSTVPYILTRASDYDTSGSGTNEVQAGDFILILSSTLANTAWVQQTPAPINFGTSNIVFIQFAAAAAGVSSFNTSLTGLTPSTNTTGAVTLAGTLGVASGGTGQTTQQAALNAISGTQTSGYHFRSDGTNVSLQPLSLADVTAGTLGVVYGGTGATTQAAALTSLGAQSALTTSAPLAIDKGGTGQITYTDGQLLVGNTATGGLSKATITAGSNVTVTNGNGTITIASTGGAAGVSSFSAGTTGLTPNTATTGAVSLAGTLAIANGGTGQTTAQTAISNLSIGMRMIEAQFTAGLVGTMNTGVSPNTFTVTALGAQNPDGYTVSVGDIVAFPLQGGGTSSQNGFWQVTTLGDSVTQAVFTRPSWFTGTVKNTMYMTRFGVTQAGYTMSVVGPVGNAEIVVGTGAISIFRISYRAANAITGVNTFTGIQTFQANGTAVNKCPFSFSPSAGLMATTQAHAVEWDGSTMYVTNASSIRNPLFYGSGGTFTGAVALKSLFETTANPNISLNTITLDLSTASYFTVTLSSNVTSFNVSFGGTPLTALSSFTLELVQDSTGGKTVAWSFLGKTLKWANGTAPTQTSTAFKSDIYTFITRDFGASYYGFVRGQNF
jgi:hypothetical protein